MKQTKEIITKNEMGTVVSVSALPCIPGNKVYLLWKDVDIIPAIVDEIRLCKNGQVRVVLSLIFHQLQNSPATIYKSTDDFGKSVFTNKSDAIRAIQQSSIIRELHSKFNELEKDGFSEFFWDNRSHKQFTGKRFRVVGRGRAPKTINSTIIPKWRIRFLDGTEIIASQGEIIPSCMKECGCPERYYADSFQYEADKQIINAFKEDFLTGVDSLENLLNNYADYARLSPSDKANLIRWSGDCSYIIDQKGLLHKKKSYGQSCQTKYKHDKEEGNEKALQHLFCSLLSFLPKTPNQILWTDDNEILCPDYEKVRTLMYTIKMMLPPSMEDMVTMGFYHPYADRGKDERAGYYYIRLK